MTDSEAKQLFLEMSIEQKFEYLYRENERRLEEIRATIKALRPLAFGDGGWADARAEAELREYRNKG